MISPDIKEPAIKVAEMMALLSRRLADAVASDDMITLRRELDEIATSMQSAGTMLAIGLQNTAFDTAALHQAAAKA